MTTVPLELMCQGKQKLPARRVLFCFKESFGFLCVFGFLRIEKKKKEQGVAGSLESLFGTTPLEQVAREGL